ncbi:MAG: response regulator [Planctomycetaceae bacterium]|nr:response regulator [Planctomycetaceae bacterium]
MTPERTVLLIEDEPSIRLPLVDDLREAGYRVLVAPDGERGLALALSEDPALVLLDLMLPGRDGFSVLRALRADRCTAPVIVLTARGEGFDRIQGLELGADDYVVKPFLARELLLRMEALLARVRGDVPGLAAGTSVRIGAATVDFAGYRLERGNETIPLSRRELELLRYLLDREGQVLSREALLDGVWGRGVDVTPRTVDQHMLKLRKKLEPDPDAPVHLRTVRGVGYTLVR